MTGHRPEAGDLHQKAAGRKVSSLDQFVLVVANHSKSWLTLEGLGWRALTVPSDLAANNAPRRLRFEFEQRRGHNRVEYFGSSLRRFLRQNLLDGVRDSHGFPQICEWMASSGGPTLHPDI